MNGEISTAPESPPPDPGRPPWLPGSLVAGPGCSLQHDRFSTASSKVTTSRPSFLNTGDSTIGGTYFCRNPSICVSAISSPVSGSAPRGSGGTGFVQESWPSSHWLG